MPRSPSSVGRGAGVGGKPPPATPWPQGLGSSNLPRGASNHGKATIHPGKLATVSGGRWPIEDIGIGAMSLFPSPWRRIGELYGTDFERHEVRDTLHHSEHHREFHSFRPRVAFSTVRLQVRLWPADFVSPSMEPNTVAYVVVQQGASLESWWAQALGSSKGSRRSGDGCLKVSPPAFSFFDGRGRASPSVP